MITMLDGNNLEKLPTIDADTKFLWCERNRLTELPVLPELSLLNVGHNRLTTLPVLPKTLTSLTCDNNQIKFLPVLPESLTFLSCLNNPIQVLPELPPNLSTLYMSEPSSLPALPKTLRSILIISFKKLEDESWLRLLDHIPTIYYEKLCSEIMLQDVKSIVVLKKMLRSPYFNRTKVLERIVSLTMVKSNLSQLVNSDAVSLIMSY
jgi:hypothetical protein